MRMFRGFYNWDGGSETERLRQHVAELEALLAEANQSIAYWKNRYDNVAAALNYTESAHAAEREEWWELVEGYAQ